MSFYDNTLNKAESPKCLMLSMWMKDPEEQKKYHSFDFTLAKKSLIVNDSLPPLPVRCDPATERFLHDKEVVYRWQAYIHEASGQKRVRITGVLVTLPNPVGEAITEPFDTFLPKFLDFHEKTHASPDTPMSDAENEQEPGTMSDDENEQEVPRHRRRKH